MDVQSKLIKLIKKFTLQEQPVFEPAVKDNKIGPPIQVEKKKIKKIKTLWI